MRRVFRDRTEAGRALAEVLGREGFADPVVLAIPRGGVPVGDEVARALRAPLEVLVSRKLGVPGEPEVGMGAVAEGGATHLDEAVVRAARVSAGDLAAAVAAERDEVERRVAAYRGGRPLPDLRGRTAIVVDDGVARGGTARAALRAARALGPRTLVLAAPVVAGETAASLLADADHVVCVASPSPFVAVGLWYAEFLPVGEAEVRERLERSRRDRGAGGGA